MQTTLPSTNYWPKSSCAKAFWGQQELPAYRQLLADTVSLLASSGGFEVSDGLL